MTVISKAKPSQERGKVNRQKPSPENAMESDQASNGEVHNCGLLGCACLDGKKYMTLLNRFHIDRCAYDRIKTRFEAMCDNLISGFEYSPDELVGWLPLDGPYDKLGEYMVTVLCLKHMATLPNARLKHIKWNKFTIE